MLWFFNGYVAIEKPQAFPLHIQGCSSCVKDVLHSAQIYSNKIIAAICIKISICTPITVKQERLDKLIS